MKRVNVYLILIFLCSFIFVPIVRAEDEEEKPTCDSIKLRDLKKAAEKVTATYEFVYNSDNQVIGFNYLIYNVPDDMYVTYKGLPSQKEEFLDNASTLEIDQKTGIGKLFDDNITNTYTVSFYVYQKSGECGSILNSVKIKKLKYNPISEIEECSYKGLEDYVYCKPWVDTDFPYTESEIKKRIEEKILKENNKTTSECISCSENLKNEEEYNRLLFIKKLVIFGLISGIIIDLVVIINLFRKVGENRL